MASSTAAASLSSKRNMARRLPDARTLHWPARPPSRGRTRKPGVSALPGCVASRSRNRRRRSRGTGFAGTAVDHPPRGAPAVPCAGSSRRTVMRRLAPRECRPPHLVRPTMRCRAPGNGRRGPRPYSSAGQFHGTIERLPSGNVRQARMGARMARGIRRGDNRSTIRYIYVLQ